MSDQNARGSWIKGKRRPLGIIAIYNTVELALWSCLISVIVLFAVFVVPHLPEIHRQQESARLLRIKAQQEFYCQRLGKPAGSDDFSRCMSELQAYRRSIERRLAQEMDF